MPEDRGREPLTWRDGLFAAGITIVFVGALVAGDGSGWRGWFGLGVAGLGVVVAVTSTALTIRHKSRTHTREKR